MKSDYAKKYLDPRWQKLRLECLEAAKWTCIACGDTAKTLHVHHPYYMKGRDPWDYPAGVMMVLCDGCHSEEHGFAPGESYGDWETIVAGIGSRRWDHVSVTIDYAQSYGVNIAQTIIDALESAAAEAAKK